MNNSMLVETRPRSVTPGQVVLVLGDVVAFAVFAVGGTVRHSVSLGPFPIFSVIEIAAPFAVSWFILAWLWGAFRADALYHPAQMLSRVFIAWLSGGCIGLVARTIILDRPLDPDFAPAALGIVGALLLGWRLVASIVATRMPRKGIE